MNKLTSMGTGYHTMDTTEEFDHIKKRFYEATGGHSFSTLSTFLGTLPSQISDARRRLRIPEQWFHTIAAQTGTSLTWLKHGSGSKL